MTEINDKKLAKTFDDSLDVLSHRLNSHSDEPLTKGEHEQLEVAKMVFTGYPKIRSAQAQVAGVGLKILSAAAENPEQYRQFVREHMPKVSPLITIPQILEGRVKSSIDAQRERTELIATSLAKEKEYQDKIDELEFENMQLKDKLGQS